MSTGGVGQLNAERGQRQRFPTSVVRHDGLVKFTYCCIEADGRCFCGDEVEAVRQQRGVSWRRFVFARVRDRPRMRLRQ